MSLFKITMSKYPVGDVVIWKECKSPQEAYKCGVKEGEGIFGQPPNYVSVAEEKPTI